MNKEQQNLLWACLPKKTRAKLKRAYKYQCPNRDYNRGFNEALEDVFSSHNLTSDTEPEEILIAKADDVKEFYKNGQFLKRYKETKSTGELIESWLVKLFGDKCLPDKEQSKPKFKVGDKVIAIDNISAIFPGPMIIKSVSLIEDGKHYYNVIEYGFKFHEDNLEPYTEEPNVSTNDTKDDTKESRNLSQNIANCDKSKDNHLKDNMKEKELNLA